LIPERTSAKLLTNLAYLPVDSQSSDYIHRIRGEEQNLHCTTPEDGRGFRNNSA